MKEITGKQLRMARHFKNMTQEDVANLLGINRSYVSQIENGKANPSKSLQKRIHRYFGDIIGQLNSME